MKLRTSHREEPKGVLKGTKHYYISGTVEFNEEEKSIIEERGLFDLSVEIPAATPEPGRASDFAALLLQRSGFLLIPIGFLSSCVAGLAHSNASGPLFILCIVGIALFVAGKLKFRADAKRIENWTQKLAIRRLLSDPSFLIWAGSIDDCRTYEEIAKHQFSQLSDKIKTSTSVAEDNTYEF